jgi:hypothetical protein
VRDPPKARDDTETDITTAVMLQEILLAPGTRPHVVADCYVVDQEGTHRRNRFLLDPELYITHNPRHE